MTGNSLARKIEAQVPAMNEIGFIFTVLYRDEHLAKIRVSVRNDLFAGTANIYVTSDQLAETANELHGFPTSVSDIRQLTLGTFDPDSAGGGISMRLYCTDRSGHICVDSKVASERDSSDKIQSATLTVPIEANAVDSFVCELQNLASGATRVACLRGRVAQS